MKKRGWCLRLGRKFLPAVLVFCTVFLLVGGSLFERFAPRVCPVRTISDSSQYPAISVWSRLAEMNVAQAIPAFARKNNFTCMTCHNALPYLNKTGRKFKEAGYRFLDDEGNVTGDKNVTLSPNAVIEPQFPVSVRFLSRPYDKTKGSDAKLHPLHAAELLGMGNFYKWGSFHVEFEAEDEDGFTTKGAGRLGLHPFTFLNLYAGYGSIFNTDPYNSLFTGHHGLTVAHKAPFNQAYEGNYALRRAAQFVNLYGRLQNFFYSAGFTAGPADAEGSTPRLGYGRFAYDIADWLSVGAFVLGGQKGDEMAAGAVEEIVHIVKYGGDLNASYNNFHLAAVVLSAKDIGAATETNVSGYGELIYTFLMENRPIFMPLFRVDWAQAQGAGTTTSLTGNVSSYIFENFRTGFEAMKQVNTPTGTAKSWRATLFADLAF